MKCTINNVFHRLKYSIYKKNAMNVFLKGGALTQLSMKYEPQLQSLILC
jgi:hypothetical protein